MKILMLGWEYPPHIAGGLGTACEGLTNALARQHVTIHFIVPQLFGGERAGHMRLSDSENTTIAGNGELHHQDPPPVTEAQEHALTQKISTVRIPAFLSPYWSPGAFRRAAESVAHRQLASLSVSQRQDDTCARALVEGEVFGIDLVSALAGEETAAVASARYGADIFQEVERFTANVLRAAANLDFDIIHAHDWMTFPAAVALAQITGRPLVVHIHSLEYDRSGLFVNEQISQVERYGLEAADKVVAVSYFTQKSLERYHHVPHEKIAVVHNGVYPRQAVQDYRLKRTWPKNVVLFLGRVTFQKGPDYFVEVASRVIPHVPDVLFVLAGAGDMLDVVKQRVNELGLQGHFLFPGFLKGEELEEMFSVADLYVMPSVSEPFGITALEAISFETPVIISRQSGVSEVLNHALKTDFWDLDRMADLIINALLHEELRSDMVVMAKEEVKRLHWDAAATKTLDVYKELAQ